MRTDQNESVPRQKEAVPVLITWDVDPGLWIPVERRRLAVDLAMNMCHEHGIRSTFFVTAQPAHVYAEVFDKLQAQGHEVGCHGFTHGDEENYDRMPEKIQRAYISQAAEILQEVAKRPIRAFRSPRVKISALTLELLVGHNYLVDSSVCSQRMDLVSSNLVNLGWLIAPRRPYHPHTDNAYRRGGIPIWEVPVSALVAPFISSLTRVVGLDVMKLFFRLLYAESRLTGKPIVYLAHPAEFLPKRTTQSWKQHLKREFFTLSYIRANGLRVRNLLRWMRGEALLAATQSLFDYMVSFPNTSFMTVSEYAERYLVR